MAVFFFLLWMILNGRITWETVLIGLAVTAGVSAVFYRVSGYTLEKDKKLFRNFLLLVEYVLVLVAEILKASFSVALFTFRPGAHPSPVLVEFDTGLPGSFRNVLLANSITLTPGTFTVRQDGSRFLVHCLTPAYAKGIDDSRFIRLLRRLT